MTGFTTDREGLLAAIIANTNDDGLRLIYADWLDENDDPEQAELIRIQIDYESNKGQYQCHQFMYSCGENCSSIDQLLQSGCDQCKKYASYEIRRKELTDYICWKRGTDNLDFTYERGLPNEVRCTLADWMANGPEIVRQEPVTKVVLTDFDAQIWGPEEYTIWDASTLHSQAAEGPGGGDLLHDLFSFLKSGTFMDDWRDYQTREEAIADLSQACLAWAKSQS